MREIKRKSQNVSLSFSLNGEKIQDVSGPLKQQIKKIKALKALVGRFCPSVIGWENSPQRGLNPCPAEPGYTLPLQTV